MNLDEPAMFLECFLTCGQNDLDQSEDPASA